MRPVVTFGHLWALLIVTGGAAFCIECWVRLARMLLLHRPDRFFDVDTVGAGWEPVGYALLVVVGVILLALSAMAWGSLLVSGVQFQPDSFWYWDWRGRVYRVPYQNVTDLTWKLAPGQPPTRYSRRALRASYIAEDAGNMPRSLTILTDIARRQPLARLVKDELVRRCGLISLAGSWAGDEHWVRPAAAANEGETPVGLH